MSILKEMCRKTALGLVLTLALVGTTVQAAEAGEEGKVSVRAMIENIERGEGAHNHHNPGGPGVIAPRDLYGAPLVVAVGGGRPPLEDDEIDRDVMREEILRVREACAPNQRGALMREDDREHHIVASAIQRAVDAAIAETAEMMTELVKNVGAIDPLLPPTLTNLNELLRNFEAIVDPSDLYTRVEYLPQEEGA